MSDRVDQFESIFKRASKERFRYAQPDFESVVLVTDLPRAQASSLLKGIQTFLAALEPQRLRWELLGGNDFERESELLEKLAQLGSDLIITHRNIKQKDKNTPHSLGVYLDILTQAIPTPVLVLPDESLSSQSLPVTSVVLVVTDHLLGDYRLINHAVRFTMPEGRCHLCHIEDDVVFSYYLDAIGKIPAINTELANEELRRQLLKQPADYIQSAMEIMKEHHVTTELHAHVLMGHTLREYRSLAHKLQAKLLVMNTKDEDQLAMHGLAYPIAVEFRHLPLLML